MSVIVCSGCKTEFEQSPENFSNSCPAHKIKTDIKLLEIGRAVTVHYENPAKSLLAEFGG